MQNVPGGRCATALLAVAALAAGLAGCGVVGRGGSPAPAVSEEGVASWYGPGFEGRPTASGETFDPDALTAVHRRLPCGTRVRVTNLDNGREVGVRINDRGPARSDRILDVSAAAARALGMVRAGTARVQLVIER